MLGIYPFGDDEPVLIWTTIVELAGPDDRLRKPVRTHEPFGGSAASSQERIGVKQWLRPLVAGITCARPRELPDGYYEPPVHGRLAKASGLGEARGLPLSRCARVVP